MFLAVYARYLQNSCYICRLKCYASMEMVKRFTTYLLITVAISGMISCGSDEPSTDEYVSSSTAIKSFSLQKNEKALVNLDSVFFSIDLDNSRIYNADSLPFGTNVTRIPVSITTDGCKALTITQTKEGEEDVVVDYLKNSGDSIDFTKTVIITMTSINGLYRRNYDVRVNVHQVKPDSMSWSQLQRRMLPMSFAAAAEQKTVETTDNVYCLTRSGSQYCIAKSIDIADNKWTLITPSFGMTPAVNSLTATDDALYILSTDGDLYRSTDALTWTSCSTRMMTLVASHGTTLLGIEKDGNTYYHVTYPASSKKAITPDFPVSGMSKSLSISNGWSHISQTIIIGGRLSDNSLTGAVWGFDGSNWACLSNNRIPAAEDITLFPYFHFKTATNKWITTKYSALVAFGGLHDGGKLAKTVYFSLDNGVNWKVAPSEMQLPDYIPAMTNSQAIVNASVLSRHSTPIDEWECPYIYLFGGENASGSLYNTVWRGVINRLQFKPVI